MPLVNRQASNSVRSTRPKDSIIPGFINAVVLVFGLLLLNVAASPASAASLSQSVDVEGTPAAVWSMIGPFCAIADWLPPVGTCTEDGNVPPTRTLVTKDGKATLVEKQTSRSDTRHFYSYTFMSSPLPVKNYKSTIEVEARGKGVSTVTWRGAYTPDPGKEKDANDALAGIYSAGLDAIRTRFAK
jgi:Polyketide cyclase / dehydrase and lipid transport